MSIKKVLHHLLVCRTAVSVMFALKSGKRGPVEGGARVFRDPAIRGSNNVNSSTKKKLSAKSLQDSMNA